jgi:hypothetical protein
MKNCWAGPGVDEKAQGREGAFLRVWKDISSINHSCRPNAVLSFQKNGTAEVVTTRPIPAGAGVEFNYVARSWRNTIKQRRKELDKLCNFQ